MSRRIAIVGSRDFPDLDRVRAYVRSLPRDVVVLSGGARGVDRTAEFAARCCGLEVGIYLADWPKNGRRAGFMRNAQIVAAADEVVAFWDGESKGTAHTIKLARQANKPVTIISPGRTHGGER